MRKLHFNTVNYQGDDWEHSIQEDQLDIPLDLAISNIDYEQGNVTFVYDYSTTKYTHSVRAKHITAWCIEEKKNG